MKANHLRRLLNVYPPFLGAGIHIKRIAMDYRAVDVEMKLRWYNRNYVGTHFGGSLYAMTDPFYMLMLINILGESYTVWDTAAHIDFVAPGRGTVLAKFRLTNEQIENVRAKTNSGEKFLPQYPVEMSDIQNNLIAKVTKTLYIRKKTPGMKAIEQIS